MMKRPFYICLMLLSLLASCQFASFTARPGVPVTAYPQDMYGTYRHIDEHDGIKDTHVLTVNEKGAVIDNDNIIGGLVDLTDTNNSLTHLGDFYYLNVKVTDSTGRSVWFVYPFEYDQKHLYIYKLLLNKKSLKRMKRAGLKPSGLRNGEYLMNDEAFKHYCEKHMRRKEALKFIRIK